MSKKYSYKFDNCSVLRGKADGVLKTRRGSQTSGADVRSLVLRCEPRFTALGFTDDRRDISGVYLAAFRLSPRLLMMKDENWKEGRI